MFKQRDTNHDDVGMTLVEVIITMVLITALVSFYLALTIRISSTTAMNSRRVAAANLANRQIENVRSDAASKVPDGAIVIKETIGSITYTVTQTANYVAQNTEQPICNGTGNELQYKLVSVSVTWPDMGRVPPVRVDTLKALGAGEGMNTTTGMLAVFVGDGADRPIQNATVKAGGKQVLTGADGCAVISGLAPGSYSATATATQHVDTNGSSTVTSPAVQVAAGTIARTRITFGALSGFSFNPTPVSGFQTPPLVFPLTMRSAYMPRKVLPLCSEVDNQACVTPFYPRRAMNLYPATYEVWFGSCDDAGVITSVQVGPTAGATNVRTGSAIVKVQDATGQPVAGAIVHAIHAPENGGGCPSGETYQLPTTNTAGETSVLLPYGKWTFSPQRTVVTGSPTATLVQGSTPTVIIRLT